MDLQDPPAANGRVRPQRLSPMDASFLEVESASAHMHVGWAALFSPPDEGQRPDFEALRAHVAARLCRAPRYRQRLLPVPFGLSDPVWADDPRFAIDRHVLPWPGSDIGELVDTVMSSPLERDRPLWEIWVADNLADGRIGIIGKAHHCMVDGVAAVELASLLLDPEPDPPAPPADEWSPAEPPDARTRLVDSVRARADTQLDLARLPLRLVSSPERLRGFASQAVRASRALAHSAGAAPPSDVFNHTKGISPLRHLAATKRPLDDLRNIRRTFGTTVNDVVLAATAGGLRRFLERRGESPGRLKAMVPVSVRGDEEELGNRISFMFIELPVDEPDPVRRLRDVHLATSQRKDAGEPEGADTALKSFAYAPRTVQRMLSHVVASPRMFNLVVSNIPGPSAPLYMLGCLLDEAYPVVPLADRHALSIGITTIRDQACFGIYADRHALPDSDLLAADLDAALEDLLSLSVRPVVRETVPAG